MASINIKHLPMNVFGYMKMDKVFKTKDIAKNVKNYNPKYIRENN